MREVVAPPINNGTVNPKRSISFATYTISSNEGVIKPESPIISTSRIHTAVKIDPHYSGPVIHVLDASRSVPVAGRLLQSELTQNQIFTEIKQEYEQLRISHAARQKDKNYLNIAQAREKSSGIDWTGFKSCQPSFLGVKYFQDYSLAEIAKYIDWTPFFSTWQLSGKYPKIFENETVGEEARKLFRSDTGGINDMFWI